MNHHALQPSIYQPLNSSAPEIRLLRIEGASPPPSSFASYVESKQTRLLNILEGWIPPLRHPTTAIQCRLETFKLQETPPYRALSYTWGDTCNPGSIEVDGQTVPVSRNLLNALRRIRRDHWLPYLWVDALCINQGDDDEKSLQVPLMSKIYGMAESVFVWLGEEQSGTSRAFSFIRTSASSTPPFNEQEANTTAGSRIAGLEKQVSGKAKALSSKANKAAVQQLFENPYWRRIWVLQEVAHATSVLVICGRHVISFFDIILSASFWDLINNISIEMISAVGWQREMEPFSDFRDIILGYPHHPVQSPEITANMDEGSKAYFKDVNPAHSDIFRLFVKTRQFRATDNRDKAYALLNLLRHEDVFLEPDYRRSEQNLYLDIITGGIRHYNSLFCISIGGVGVFPDSSPRDLPSWIPDFLKIGNSEIPYANPVSMSGYSNQGHLDACRSEAPDYSFGPEDSKHLSAKGFLCDTIKLVIREPTWLATFRSIAEALKTYESRKGHQTRIYGELFRSLFPPHFFRDAPKDPDDSYAEALGGLRRILASTFMLHIGIASYHKYFENKLARVKAEIARQGLRELTKVQEIELLLTEEDPALSYMGLAVAIENGLSEYTAVYEALYQQAVAAFGDEYPHDIPLPYHILVERSSLEGSVSVFYGSLGKLWSNRAFVLTEGGFMGFARPGAQAGDKVCILYGCPVPLVVRPDMSEFFLVGDCYFEGIMQGEMVEKQEEGDFILEHLTFK